MIDKQHIIRTLAMLIDSDAPPGLSAMTLARAVVALVENREGPQRVILELELQQLDLRIPRVAEDPDLVRQVHVPPPHRSPVPGRVCQRCGHRECPCCTANTCDRMIDGKECCQGRCTYLHGRDPELQRWINHLPEYCEVHEDKDGFFRWRRPPLDDESLNGADSEERKDPHG